MTGARFGWLGALRWPSFRRVWTVWSLQQFGYWFSCIAFQWLVALKTDSDALTLSLLYFCTLVPILLWSLPAGVLADARDRRAILLVTQCVIVVISTVTAVLVFVDQAPVWALMVCGFAVGSAHSVAMPAGQAIVANSVPAEDLRSAVVLQSLGMNIARIAGPALAGVLILLWGTSESLLAYGALAVVSFLVLRGVRPAPRRPGRGSGPVHPQRLTARIRSALTHARARPPAAVALAIVAVTSLFAVSYLAQLPVLAARVSDDPRAFLVLTSTGGLGSLVGVLSVALPRSAVPNVTPAAIRLAALGAVMIGFGFSTVMWLEVVLVALAGALQFGVLTQCNSVLQHVVDDDHRGRVMSLYGLCWGGLLPVGGLVLGTAWHLIGPVAALGMSGIIALAFAGYVLRPGAVRSPVREPDLVAAR